MFAHRRHMIHASKLVLTLRWSACLALAAWPAPSQAASANLELARQLNQAFIEVAEKVSTAVVVITVVQEPAAPSAAQPRTASTVAEAQQAFGALMRAVQSPGVLDARTKELLMFSLVIQSRCAPCFEAHHKKALEMGITQPELDEAARADVGEFLQELEDHDDVIRVWAAVK